MQSNHKKRVREFGRTEQVITKNCTDKQIEAILKKRNLNIKDINLIKKD